MFVELARTKLPAASAWSNLETTGPTVLTQGDLECVFYHLRLTDGMEECVRPPVAPNW
jgi:hypothetical protein